MIRRRETPTPPSSPGRPARTGDDSMKQVGDIPPSRRKCSKPPVKHLSAEVNLYARAAFRVVCAVGQSADATLNRMLRASRSLRARQDFGTRHSDVRSQALRAFSAGSGALRPSVNRKTLCASRHARRDARCASLHTSRPMPERQTRSAVALIEVKPVLAMHVSTRLGPSDSRLLAASALTVPARRQTSRVRTRIGVRNPGAKCCLRNASMRRVAPPLGARGDIWTTTTSWSVGDENRDAADSP